LARNVYCLGAPPALQQQLAAKLNASLRLEYPDDARTDDIVFLAVSADHGAAAKLPRGNAFTACRHLKSRTGVRVFLIVQHDDPYSAEIGRFCLADGCVVVDRDGAGDLSAVEASLSAARGRTAVDELLENLERELASDEGKKNSAIQRMLSDQRHDWVLDHLMDRATGLFSSAFASFKLEEEFKRATRFHQPLSLILLHVDESRLPANAAGRDACLAEAASVFLTMSRDIDVLARFTETTFLFLLPGTGSSGAAHLARRMLRELRSRVFAGDGERTATAGLATIPAHGVTDRGAFLARAEACLRLAQSGHAPDGLCVSCE
jgi:diguanylate cyclase (GGDEF)-like protein